MAASRTSRPAVTMTTGVPAACPGTWPRKLARLRAAEARLAGRQAAPGRPAARVAAARDAVDNAAQRLAQAEAAQAARMDRYQRQTAAGKARAGKKPVPADRSVRVALVRKILQTAQARLAAASQAAAAAR